MILTSERGPVVFDWSNAAAGDPAFDLAVTLVTITAVDLPLDAATAARRWYPADTLRRASTP